MRTKKLVKLTKTNLKNYFLNIFRWFNFHLLTHSQISSKKKVHDIFIENKKLIIVQIIKFAEVFRQFIIVSLHKKSDESDLRKI